MVSQSSQSRPFLAAATLQDTVDRRPRIWIEVSWAERVVFHQLHNRSAAMAGGREHSDRKATRFQCWSISAKMSVSSQEHLGQRKPRGRHLCRQMAFSVIKITTVILHSHWKRGGEEDGRLQIFVNLYWISDEHTHYTYWGPKEQLQI